MFLKNKTPKFNTTEKLFIICFLILLISQFASYFLFSNDFDSKLKTEKNCAYFLPAIVDNLDNFEIEKQNKDVYVFPEIKNILCLGRIVSYEIQDNIVFVYLGTNSKFINLLILSSQLFLFIVYSFIFKKENYKIINSLVLFFLVSTYFHSFNVISYFYLLTFPTIFLYLNNAVDNLDYKTEKFKTLPLDAIFIVFLFLSFFLVQFSSHQYETIDWDINAYLVTSLDIGRGNLPLENQFENKPPLLFLFYYLFSLIGNGSLLTIKLLNDLTLFGSVIVLYFLIKNKKLFRFEAFISSLVFILFTSNYWFHPGFSEIFALLFISLSYLNLIKSNKTKTKFFVSGFIFGLSTLVNIGSAIFLIGFTLIVLMISNLKYSRIFEFYFGLCTVHIFLFIFYLLNGLTNEYLISVLFIPISYSQTEISIFSELLVFLTSFFKYNIILCSILFASTANIIGVLFKNLYFRKELMNDISTYTSILFLNSCLFYYTAAKGYYHHLFFVMFFVTFGISKVPKSKYKFLILTGVLMSSFQIFTFFLPQTTTNLKYFDEIENNYPIKKVSHLVKKEVNKNDKIFATENILLLYYLNEPNSSYIVHPALYEYEEIISVLERYNKVQINEKTLNFLKYPKIIEGKISDEIEKKYHKLDTQNLISENIHFYDREKTVEIFLRKD